MIDPTELHLYPVQQRVSRLRVQLLDGPDCQGAALAGALDCTGERVTVGTSPDNQLVVTDPSVSRHHLELRGGDGILVKDMGSRNGTFIGDVRVHEAVVPVGTHLRIGQTILALGQPVSEADLENGSADGRLSMTPYRVARAETLAAFERRYLRTLIESAGGNASAAARAAKMDRPYLLSLLRRHGLR